MLVDNVYVDKPWCDWTGEESRKAQYNSVAKNVIISSLNLDEFFKVSSVHQLKRCETFLKLRMRERAMSKEQESTL